MKMKRAILLSLISISSLVNAALIDHDTYSSDTATGMDWLDLTQTRGQSFDEVMSQTSAGQLLEGWRFATKAEIGQFWANAGGVAPFTGAAEGVNNWVGRLQALWGKTYPFIYAVNGHLVQGTIAMTGEASVTCATCNLTVYLLDNIDISNSSTGDYAELVQANEAYRWQGQTPIGHALVRQATAPIPEPASVMLAIFGLVATAFSTRRKIAEKMRSSSNFVASCTSLTGCSTGRLPATLAAAC
jgi:hypothetical protein